jgi:translation elongation factor P/translation initiation factor 5A
MMDKKWHGMDMECCEKHKMSKEHLEKKKKMLEEKLKWITEELEKQ